GTSDGSAQRPFATIAAGVAAAPSGAIVAVAAGRYPESVAIQGKAIRLWGRCPKMVEIASTGAAAVTITASASELHTVALTGAGDGVSTAGANGVALDRLRIHDTTRMGVNAGGDFTLKGSLIESVV